MAEKKQKIFLDRGHDDMGDVGAVGYVQEREKAVKITDFQHTYLKNNYVCSLKKSSGKSSLAGRIRTANKWGADFYCSNHLNAFRPEKGDGYEACIYSEDNMDIAKIFEEEVAKVGQNIRPTKIRPDLAVTRDTNCKAILNECAFVDTWKDIKDWDEDFELQIMGEALAKATAKVCNLPKKAKAKTLKVGAKVKIKTGATDLNTKKKYKAWVYTTKYTVISIDGNRVVFGKNGVVTGATKKANIKLV